VDDEEAAISERSWFAKGTMFCTVDSKSKSNPSMTELPNGRGTEDEVEGPKIDQILFAAVTAASEEEKPPSVYVDPPMESRIVLP
jgi:hypothetical protein